MLSDIIFGNNLNEGNKLNEIQQKSAFSFSSQKILQEIEDLFSLDISINVKEKNENLYELTFNHEGGYNYLIKKVKILLLFDQHYPKFPPKVKFITKMFHPNIEENGMLAQISLFERWNSHNDLTIIFFAIKHILQNPNLNEGLIANQKAYQLFLENQNEYIVTAFINMDYEIGDYSFSLQADKNQFISQIDKQKSTYEIQDEIKFDILSKNFNIAFKNLNQDNQIIIEDLNKDGIVNIMFQDEKFEQFRDLFFLIKIKLEKDFPYSPPKVKFLSRMFHPNISENGVMELVILNEKWNPTLDMKAVLDEIKQVLKNPNLEFGYCVNNEAKILFLESLTEYFNTWLNIFHDSPALNDSDFESQINQVIQKEIEQQDQIKQKEYQQRIYNYNQVFQNNNQVDNQQEQPQNVHLPEDELNIALNVSILNQQTKEKRLFFKILKYLDRKDLHQLQLVSQDFYKQLIPLFSLNQKIYYKDSYSQLNLQAIKIEFQQNQYAWAILQKSKSDIENFLNEKQLIERIYMRQDASQNFQETIKNASIDQKDQNHIVLLIAQIIGQNIQEIEINDHGSSLIDYKEIILDKGNHYQVKGIQEVDFSAVIDLNQCISMFMQKEALNFSILENEKSQQMEWEFLDQEDGWIKIQKQKITVVYIHYM